MLRAGFVPVLCVRESRMSLQGHPWLAPCSGLSSMLLGTAVLLSPTASWDSCPKCKALVPRGAITSCCHGASFAPSSSSGLGREEG